MPIDIEKSSTRKQPLRRGIHITEQKDYRVNPEPLVLQEADFLLEEFLSPTKLVCNWQSRMPLPHVLLFV